jgi:YihY family inner membrane protein
VITWAEGRGIEPMITAVRWLWVFYLELWRDRAFVRAAGMSYTTLVALVPLLVIVLGVLSATGSLGEDAAFTAALLVDRLFGEVPQVGDVLLKGVLAVDLSTLGAVALAGLLVVAARLFLTVERAYSDFFGVVVRRNLPRRLLNFWFTLTVVPVVLAVTLNSSIGLASAYGASWATHVVPMGLQFLLLLAALKLLPSVHVRWIPALAGAATSWALIELGRRLFGFYVGLITAGVDPLAAVYGSIGLVPVFLAWIYLLWLFVLVGVEVANVVQNYPSLLAAESEVEGDRHRFPSVDTGLQLLACIAASFVACRGPVGLKDIGARTGLAARAIRQGVDVLITCGLVVEAEHGFLLARPPDRVLVRDVVDAWRALTVPSAAENDRVRAEIDQRLQLEGTLAEAVARWAPEAPG